MRTAIAAITAVLALVPSAYAADKINVANDGVDSAGCGGTASPCRTITRAIANAAPGDTIIVGPGTYGDVNASGITGDGPNEEPGQAACRSVGAGCMLHIDKAVTVLSSHGAAATVISASTVEQFGPLGDALPEANVFISASSVRFGAPAQGFTVTATGGNSEGIVVRGSDVVVEGNQVVMGFGFGDPSRAVNGIVAVSGNLIQGNQVAGWRTGIAGLGSTVIHGNSVQLNRTGIQSGPSSAGAANGVVSANFVFANLTGILLDSTISQGNGTIVTGNAVVGNALVGIDTDEESPLASTARIEGNNIYSNGCGVRTTLSGVPATNNYWGAATGPGVDPADDVCGTGTVIVAPFATKGFNVKVNIKP